MINDSIDSYSIRGNTFWSLSSLYVYVIDCVSTFNECTSKINNYSLLTLNRLSRKKL